MQGCGAEMASTAERCGAAHADRCANQDQLTSGSIAQVAKARIYNGLTTRFASEGTRRNVSKRRRLFVRPSLLMVCFLPTVARGFAFPARTSPAPDSLPGNALSSLGQPRAQHAPAARFVHSAPFMTSRSIPFAGHFRRLLESSTTPSSSLTQTATTFPAMSNQQDSKDQTAAPLRTTAMSLSSTGTDSSADDESFTCTNPRGRFSFAKVWRRRFDVARRTAASGAARVGRTVVEASAAAASVVFRRRRIASRAAGVALVSAVAFVALQRPAVAALLGSGVAHHGRALVAMMPAPSAVAGAAPAQMSLELVAPKLALWFTLFVTSAAFHAAEIAITTLYPWKVKEFAEEEGERSPFQVLNKDITRVLTTILVATTVCTIYNAALFTNLAIQMFGSAGLAYATAALTITTLFFGELLPKALGVNNAEVVARRILPIIIVLSWLLNPVAKSFTMMSKLMLSMLGFKSTETGRVSEEELRLIVTGAKQSGGIESQEGMMIEGVLDLQDTKIYEIMRPRVEVVAIEANSTMMDLYDLHQESKYSRIPVYSGEIDRISGVVLSKDLLEFVQDPGKLSSILVADAMESTYFVPETMSVWNVLEEMRRRRLHMAIVVDEYGGTAGVVTLEDILEEVVGEIYDEKEDDDFREEEHYINVNEDGSFTIHGMADLEDVCTSLAFQQVNEEDLREFGTLSGYLCSQAGEIPAVGDYVMVGGYMFTITKADERRIEEVHARLIGALDAPEPEDRVRGKGGSGGGRETGAGGSRESRAGAGEESAKGDGETVGSTERSPPTSSATGSAAR